MPVRSYIGSSIVSLVLSTPPTMSQQWHFSGYARRIGDDNAALPPPSQRVVDCDMEVSREVVAATSSDVASMQCVAASRLAMEMVTSNATVAVSIDDFVVRAAMALTGHEIDLCAEAHELSEE